MAQLTEKELDGITTTKSMRGFIIDEAEWELMCALDPHFNELSFEENRGRYLVINTKNDDGVIRWLIVKPEVFEQHFDHITNGEPIKMYNFVQTS